MLAWHGPHGVGCARMQNTRISVVELYPGHLGIISAALKKNLFQFIHVFSQRWYCFFLLRAILQKYKHL